MQKPYMSEGKILEYSFDVSLNRKKTNLVGGLEHDFYFSHHIGNFIIPTDEVHHFSEGVGQPPTRLYIYTLWLFNIAMENPL